MNIEDYRDYCLSLPFVEESTSFGDDVLVYKIGGKIFSLTSIIGCTLGGATSGFDHFAVKCDPDIALLLRDTYPEVTPAFHLNKKHWNDISVIGRLDDVFCREQIFAAYMLVLQKSVVPKSLRTELLEKVKQILG